MPAVMVAASCMARLSAPAHPIVQSDPQELLSLPGGSDRIDPVARGRRQEMGSGEPETLPEPWQVALRRAEPLPPAEQAAVVVRISELVRSVERDLLLLPSLLERLAERCTHLTRGEGEQSVRGRQLGLPDRLAEARRQTAAARSLWLSGDVTNEQCERVLEANRELLREALGVFEGRLLRRADMSSVSREVIQKLQLELFEEPPVVVETVRRLALHEAELSVMMSRLTEANLRLVAAAARPFLGRGIPFADLMSAGSTGLVEAQWYYDPEGGASFTTWSFYSIRKEILELFKRERQTIRIPDSAWHAARDGSGPPLPRVIGFDQMLRDEDSDRSALDIVAPDPREGPEAVVEQADTLRALRTAVAKLPERVRQVIERRFPADGEPMVLEDIALELGVTIDRVRVLEAQGVKLLRGELSEDLEPTEEVVTGPHAVAASISRTEVRSAPSPHEVVSGASPAEGDTEVVRLAGRVMALTREPKSVVLPDIRALAAELSALRRDPTLADGAPVNEATRDTFLEALTLLRQRLEAEHRYGREERLTLQLEGEMLAVSSRTRLTGLRRGLEVIARHLTP